MTAEKLESAELLAAKLVGLSGFLTVEAANEKAVELIRADREAVRAAAIEECARVCRDHATQILTDTPLTGRGSASACEACADAIEALRGKP